MGKNGNCNRYAPASAVRKEKETDVDKPPLSTSHSGRDHIASCEIQGHGPSGLQEDDRFVTLCWTCSTNQSTAGPTYASQYVAQVQVCFNTRCWKLKRAYRPIHLHGCREKPNIFAHIDLCRRVLIYKELNHRYIGRNVGRNGCAPDAIQPVDCTCVNKAVSAGRMPSRRNLIINRNIHLH